MSSPKVLVFDTVPWEQAVAHNREACAEYLELAERVYAELVAIVAEVTDAGFADAVLDCPTPEEARARVEALFSAESDGAGALSFAHAYWQDLKHRWGEPLYERQNQLHTKIQDESILSLINLKSSQSQLLRHDHRDESHHHTENSSRKDQLTREVMALSRSFPEMEQEIADKLRSTPAELIEVVLQATKLSLQTRLDAQARNLALQAELAARKNRLVEEMMVRIGILRRKLPTLGEEAEELLGRKIEHFSSLMLELDEEEIESAFDGLVQEFQDLRRRRTVIQAVMKILKQSGFQEVKEMQTITPEQLRKSYFQAGDDETRLVELVFAGEGQQLKIEVVRTEASDGSSLQKRDDLQMQRRVCKTTEIIERTLGADFSVKELLTEEPGQKPLAYRESLRKKRHNKKQSVTASKRHVSKP
jgi:hypothetical protein